MRIRRFKPSDLDTILQLFYDVVRTVGAKYYSPQQVQAWAPEQRDDRDLWLKSLTDNITYVVEGEGKIVGFGDMTHSGYIDRLYVHKDYQGRGIALALFKKFEEDARQLGLRELTTEANSIAKPLAQRQGFVVVREERRVRRGVEFINYFMRKTLS